MHNKKKIIDIEIGYTNLLISLPIFVAFQNNIYGKNIFEKYGLNVSLIKYTSANEMIEDLNQGKINMCGYCALPIAFKSMSSNQQKFIYVGGVYEDDEHQISLLLTKKGETFNSFSDLRNKKIGVFPTKAYEVWIKRIVHYFNIGEDNVDIIKIKNDENLESQIEKEDFDAIFINSSIATDLLTKKYIPQKFETKAIIPSVTHKNPLYFGSFNIREDFALDFPDIVKKISLSLDKSVDIINKSKSSVRKAIKTFLSELNMSSIEYLPNFKKTNEVKDRELGALENYYFNQRVFPNVITVDNLQYRYFPLGAKFKLRWNKFVEKFKKHIALISVIITIISLIIPLIISNRRIRNSIAQSNKQLEILQKSTPAQFSLSVSTNDATVLSNIGISSLRNIRVDYRFYFITKTGKLYLATNLSEVAKTDTILLNTFISSGLVLRPEDFNGLFGTSRGDLPIASLKPFNSISDDSKHKNGANKANMDISKSSIINALRCSEILNAAMIMKWSIRYNEELSRKEMIDYKYVWFKKETESGDYIPKELEFQLGGKCLIKIIDTYENNTKDIIFSNDAKPSR